MSRIDSHLPGRLGDPAATLQTDPRADPRIVAAFAAAGAFSRAPIPIEADPSYERALDYCLAFEAMAAEGYDLLRAAMPSFPSLATSTETVDGVDGNKLTLFVDRPRDVEGPLPCIVHTHGGAMVFMSAEDPLYVRWRKSLAELGMVVVGVEFRNGAGRLGNHPFPAGLNDCARAVNWVHERRADLGVSKIVLSGESGGGNLALATALKAKQEGWLDQIDGVYAMCPYISGAYADPPPALLSLRENDGYMLSGPQMAAFVKAYDPTSDHAANPLAWPYRAEHDDLVGLPPHYISVNELDPLRDEGLAYYRKLLAAGVSAVARTVHGTPHAGDRALPDVTPELYRDTLGSIEVRRL